MDFDAFKDTLRVGVKELAKNTVKEFAEDAKTDMEAFVDDTKGDLQRWTTALAEGTLTQEDYAFLLKMRMDVAKMHALTATGVSQARINRFQQGLISLLMRSALTII